MSLQPTQTPIPQSKGKVSKNFSMLCPCTEKEIRFSFTVLMFILGLVTYAIITFMNGINSVKQWLAQKDQLKGAVKNYAEQTRLTLLQSPSSVVDESDIYPVSTQDPQVQDWMDYIESRKIGSPKGYLFIIDTSGRVYAHGKASFLASKGNNVRAPGFQNLRELDDPKQKSTPIANIIRTAKKGGGYVYFTWKKDESMLAYVAPIKGTNLILGGAVPVPKNKRIKRMETTPSIPNMGQNNMDGPMALI